MNLNFKTIPSGTLPYIDKSICKQNMIRLFEEIPYLPDLPVLSSEENVLNRTIENIPCFTKEKRLELIENDVKKIANKIDALYNSSDYAGLDAFKSSSLFFEDYIKIINRIKPQNTIIRLMGPFSLMKEISNIDLYKMISDRAFRKFFLQCIVLKAIWYINQVKSVSPDTAPIILFEDYSLNKFGTLKLKNETVTDDTITNIYQKLSQKIHSAGAYIGIECFEKCNWQLMIESNVDLISFNALNHHTSFSIITDKINSFLSKGGYINWAYIPTSNETSVKNIKIDEISRKLENIMNELVDDGVRRELLYNHSTVSVLGNVDKLPIIFAEKALIISTQLGKRIANLADSLHR